MSVKKPQARARFAIGTKSQDGLASHLIAAVDKCNIKSGFPSGMASKHGGAGSLEVALDQASGLSSLGTEIDLPEEDCADALIGWMSRETSTDNTLSWLENVGSPKYRKG